jgi:hypothetical protein
MNTRLGPNLLRVFSFVIHWSCSGNGSRTKRVRADGPSQYFAVFVPYVSPLVSFVIKVCAHHRRMDRIGTALCQFKFAVSTLSLSLYIYIYIWVFYIGPLSFATVLVATLSFCPYSVLPDSRSRCSQIRLDAVSVTFTCLTGRAHTAKKSPLHSTGTVPAPEPSTGRRPGTAPALPPTHHARHAIGRSCHARRGREQALGQSWAADLEFEVLAADLELPRREGGRRLIVA